MVGDTNEKCLVRRVLSQTPVKIMLITGFLVGVSLAVLLVDQVSLRLLDSTEIQAKQTLVVTVFNLFLAVAYAGLVITNREQLSTMEDEVDLLRSDYEPDLPRSRYEYDGDEVTINYRNRGPGTAFNPTLVTRIKTPDGDEKMVTCPVKPHTDVESNRVLEPGSTIERRFEVFLPTDDGVAPFSEAVGSYSEQGPSAVDIRVVYDTALGEPKNRYRDVVEFTPGVSETLEEVQQRD